jgi:NAD-dependent deacetylase
MKILRIIEKKKIHQAAELILNSKEAIVLSGAGVSTESGIPDFRGEDGIWKKFPIDTFGTLESLLKNPAKFWELAHKIAPNLFKAKPNPGHYALAELEKMDLD